MPEPNELDSQTMSGLVSALATQVKLSAVPVGMANIDKARAKQAIGYTANQRISKGCWEFAWESLGRVPGMTLVKGSRATAFYLFHVPQGHGREGEMKYRIIEGSLTRKQRDEIVETIILVVEQEKTIHRDDVMAKVGDVLGYIVTGRRLGPLYKSVYANKHITLQGDYLVWQPFVIAPEFSSKPEEVETHEAESVEVEPAAISFAFGDDAPASITGLQLTVAMADELTITTNEDPFEVHLDGPAGSIQLPVTMLTIRFKKRK